MEGDGAGSIYESLSADDKRAHGLRRITLDLRRIRTGTEYRSARQLAHRHGQAQRKPGRDHLHTSRQRSAPALSQMIDDALLDVDPAVYLQLAAAPDEADIYRRSDWFACNEALGKFLDLGEFRAQAAQAKRLPSFRAKFENLGSISASTRTCNSFPTPTGWSAPRRSTCARSPASRAMPASICRRPRICGAGAVLAAQRRRAAVLLATRGGLLDRDRKEGGHYRTWRDAGLLETTPGQGDQLQGHHPAAWPRSARNTTCARRL